MEYINSYARLENVFYERINPTKVSDPELFLWNDSLSDELDARGLFGDDRKKLARIFSGNEMLDGFEPIALAYAGHQFGNFVPQLGDGRAHLLCELMDANGIGRDLQLKGSGQSRFSRSGDGRCAMGPAIREFIMSEALHALAVPTTRSLAVVTTGEPVFREVSLAGAVVTRVALSHVRVGTFEYFAVRKNVKALRRLVDYTIKRHFPHIDQDETFDSRQPHQNSQRIVRLLKNVVDKQITLVVEWMRIGFVHGVMNTDNTALSGETIDFGPCAMMNHYNPDTVFSSIDMHGRYAFANQAKIVQWNMARFAECLQLLIHLEEKNESVQIEEVIAAIPDQFEQAWLEMIGRKIGIQKTHSHDHNLIRNLIQIMISNRSDYTNTMDHLTNIMEGNIAIENSDGANGNHAMHRALRLQDQIIPGDEIRDTAAKQRLIPSGLDDWFARWQNRLEREEKSTKAISLLMRKSNPVVIPRNHHVESVLEESQQTGNSDAVKKFLEVLRQPYQRLDSTQTYQDPPIGNESEYKTYCGT